MPSTSPPNGELFHSSDSPHFPRLTRRAAIPLHQSTLRVLFAAAFVLTLACGAGAGGGGAGDGGEPGQAKLTYANIAAGLQANCGLTSSGAAYCWGDGDLGGLGNGTTSRSTLPVLVSGNLQFATISGNLNYSFCGLTTSGAAYCWGDNNFGTGNLHGQLGNNSTANSSVPVAVSGGLTFSEVSTGAGYSCGLTTTGEAYCWGSNDSGQLGNGSTQDSLVPTAVAGGLTFASIAAGTSSTCALTQSGSAYCWGYEWYGQLGNGSAIYSNAIRTAPVAVSGGLTFKSITTGFNFACALTTAGAAFCWGEGVGGQLGNGSVGIHMYSSVPVPVSGGLAFSSVSSGINFSCGISDGGTAYCWGVNDSGTLGTGSSAWSSVPARVSGGLSFASISAGFGACGITVGGDAYCWGSNAYGQLGNGSNADSNVPVLVSSP